MNIYGIEVQDANGDNVSLEKYRDKVILIVNTATRCGFTPQYDELQDLYEQYAADGFIILDFPCNQFGNQAPESTEEIISFCNLEYGTTFPTFSKVDVNGENAAPLFRYLVGQKGFKGFDHDHPISPVLIKMMEESNPDYINQPDIKWNFTKFLIDRNGNVVERFEPTANISLIEEKIEELL